MERTALPTGHGAARWMTAVDVTVVVALAVIAFSMRRPGLPGNGLFFDDSWVAAAAVKGKVSQLVVIGADQPLYIFALKVWGAIVGDSSRRLADFAFVAGVLGGPLVYLGLVRLGFARSVSALLAALLTVSTTHAIYSGRVKSYVFEPFVVLGVAGVAAVVARRQWSPVVAAAWVVFAVGAGLFSPFVLVVVVAASLTLLLHRRRDLVPRLVAAGVAVAVLGAAHLARAGDTGALRSFWEDHHDGFPTFSWNPFVLVGTLLARLTRVTIVYPGGATGWAAVWMSIALVGLVVAAVALRASPKGVVAQVVLVAAAIGFVGGLAHQLPFGPTQVVPRAPGGRASLWLVPFAAVGIAAAFDLSRRGVARRRPAVITLDAVAWLLVPVVLVVGYHKAPPYLLPGTRSATTYVDARLGPRDLVLVTRSGMYAYAVESRRPSRLVVVEDDAVVPFVPRFDDPRVVVVPPTDRSPRMQRSLAGAARVFVLEGHAAFSSKQLQANLATALTKAGFTARPPTAFQSSRVTVWERG